MYQDLFLMVLSSVHSILCNTNKVEFKLVNINKIKPCIIYGDNTKDWHVISKKKRNKN